MTLSLVYEPITINGLEIRNRIARSAHGTSLAFQGAITDRMINYHLARAKGGVGLTILEAAAVHPSTITSFANIDDSIIDGYRRLMAAVRPHGMRVFQQLWHGGHIYPVFDRSAPWGVSSIPNPATGIVPNPVGSQEIGELIAAYAAAARRCKAGGIEGIEVHAAHGYLIMQFLNSLTNTRTDRYGGSLENRMRFLHEVMVAIRKEVGDNYPVGIRVGNSAGIGGLDEAEIAKVLEHLHADGLIDFVDASYADYWSHGFAFAMDQPLGYQLTSSSLITSAIKDLPRMVIGRIRTLEEAEQILRDGIADMVHMTRAHIADPDIVRKTQAGHPERVRPCIGCNQGCWYAVTTGGPIGCAVNPAAGNEGALSENLIEPSESPGRVLVVGGGPAGMEAARIAALRGHEVVLVEAASCLGGQVTLAKRAPRLHAIGDITYWLEQEIIRLGVEIRTNSYFEAEDTLAENADFVIVATGSNPRSDRIQFSDSSQAVPGADQSHILSSPDLFSNPHLALGSTAVVFDEVGHYEGIAATEYLLNKGLKVTFVCPGSRIAPLVCHDTRVVPALRRFADLGNFRPLTNTKLVAIDKTHCNVRSLYSAFVERIPADTVVFINARDPLRSLYDELCARGFRKGQNIALAGDALAPRDIQYAISEGHAVTRSMV
ncbi:oxidoreductase [Rhizorhabdus argentea]|uniref:oxidoreductase n=1 Tax=Rhizorhabdus argentea TaxID=1387174 RepID=UPI0030EEC5D2